MKKIYSIAVLSLITLVCSYCQRSSFQPEAIQQDYLTFGKGGGMTNQVDTYYVLADGHVYRHNSISKEYQPVGRLKRSARSACFDKARALPASTFGCDEPGNMYYFLIIHTQDIVKSCTWGNTGFTPPEAITSFYEYTQQLANDL